MFMIVLPRFHPQISLKNALDKEILLNILKMILISEVILESIVVPDNPGRGDLQA